MKKITRLLFVFLFTICTLRSFAQAPKGMKYQAVARNAAGTVIEEKILLFDSASGKVLPPEQSNGRKRMRLLPINSDYSAW